MIPIKLIFSIFMIFLSAPSIVYADGLTCIGMDGSGQTLHVIFDVDTATININGKILKIDTGSKDGKKIWTKNYISDQGVLAKVVLVHKNPGNDDTILQQVNAVTNELIARAPLVCKKY